MEKEMARVIWNDVDIKNNCYGRWVKIKDVMKFEEMGGAVFVEKVYTNLETKEKTLLLSFRDSDGMEVTTEFKRELLTDKNIVSLVSMGAQVNKKSAPILIKVIENLEIEAEHEFLHTKLGFSTHLNQPIFKGSKGIGVESSYKGRLKIEPTGSLETWLDMVNKHVIGNGPLEAVLAMGMVGLFVEYLYEDINCENPIVSLIGESTTGKTTAAMLAISMSSCPRFKKGCMESFSSTENAIMASVQSSYPICIDEGGLLNYNPTRLLFSLAMGEEKSRLDKEYKVTESQSFRTVIFTTSERSLLCLGDKLTGLMVRNFECKNIVWTTSAESSDEIKRVAIKNYGHVMPIVAKAILGTNKEDVIDSYERYHKEFVDRAIKSGKYNHYTERNSKIFAMVLLSAEWLMKTININLDLEKMKTFLESISMVKGEDSNIGIRALKEILDYVQANPRNFTESKSSYNDQFGYIKESKKAELYNGKTSTKSLYIVSKKLKEILEQSGFFDVDVVLNNLKDLNILNNEKGRRDNKFNLNGSNVRGYILRLEDDEIVDNEIEDVKKEETKATVKKRKNYSFSIDVKTNDSDEEEPVEFED